jgi:pSer/pThr/pTyr-binding forkhead associated (FHA) protein
MHESPALPEAFVPLRLAVPTDGLSVELDRPDIVLGRHSASDVRVCLPDVSRRHCRFVFADRRWQIIDLNSLNGVFVNDQRVRQATLDHGDRIRIGTVTFDVELHEPAAVPILEMKRPDVLASIAEVLPRPKAS